MKDSFGLDASEDTFRRFITEKFKTGEKKAFLHYSVWRATIERESLHLGRMVANEALKGFISTTKAVTVAKAYAGTNGGWAYAMFVNGGFHLPTKDEAGSVNNWTALFGEEEIAYPGSIPWPQVVGFRKVGSDAKFEGPIYLRDSFVELEKDAAMSVFELLSGKSQKQKADKE